MSKWTRLTGLEKARITRLYYEGHSLTEIGRIVGRPRESVTAYLERTGHHSRMVTRMTEKDITKMLDWYQRGVTYDKICHHFGIAKCTVRYHAKKRGVPLRFPNMANNWRGGK